MATVYFQVQLSVQPTEGGEAKLVVPKVVDALEHKFILVKEGGKEGLIQVEVSATELRKIEKDKHCKKLSKADLDALKKTYPAPKLKQKFHPLPESVAGESEIADSDNRPIDTLQTVRSGFYLIDVPIVT
jgi:hypothetical protein